MQMNRMILPAVVLLMHATVGDVTMICRAVRADDSQILVSQVVPIDWKRFAGRPREGDDTRRCRQMLLNSARHNVAWIPEAAENIEQNWRKLTGRQNHDVIRPACSVAYAMAVVLKTGIFDERAVGVSKQEALARTVRLLKAAAVAHNHASWKYPWQSALWAATLGHAGWMLWDNLDAQTKGRIAAIVEFEANRFLDPDYRVPYWNGRGGDTKAEENAWNSMVLNVACAMLPEHPNALKWKTVCSELMVSAYALQKDLQNETVLDGKPVKDWLDGYNVREDGVVINHGIVHPDYMCCVSLNLWAFPVQSLAGRPVSETADFRADLVYRTLATKNWPSPPNKKPGGTIYVPGRAEVYYPSGTDWYTGRVPIYYLMDVYAHVLGWGRRLPRPAEYWMRLRAERILEKQSRHADGRLYGKNEFTRFPPREQMTAFLIAEAFLLRWLDAHGKISRKSNWLAETDASRPETNK